MKEELATPNMSSKKTEGECDEQVRGRLGIIDDDSEGLKVRKASHNLTSDMYVKNKPMSVSPCTVDRKESTGVVDDVSKLGVGGLGKSALEYKEFVDNFQEQIDLRLASSSNPTAVMELDLDGKVTYLSRNWELIVGTKIKKIVNRPISNIIIGNGAEDLNIFNNAIDQMIRNDGSYKVKFVTATNDRMFTDSDGAYESGRATPYNSTEDLTRNAVMEMRNQEPEYDSQVDETVEGSASEQSSVSSKLSNNGEIIELEAQGIIIHDPKTKIPKHSMWIIKHFVHIDLDLTLPENLINVLGFGAELFEGYLFSLQEMGIIDEESVPQPKTILCRICEQNIPVWFIEKHSDLCLVENKASEEVQRTHDAIADQRDLILRISETLFNYTMQLQSGPSLPTSLSSSTSLGLASSGNSLVLDYRGIPLPLPGTSEPFKANNQHVLTYADQGTMFLTRKFPFGILKRLADLCDESLQLNPMELNLEGQFQFTPNSERAMNLIQNWKVLETSDLAIRSMMQDTQELVNQKLEALYRLVSVLQYSEKIKKEVDELVLSTVRETVAKIKEHTMINEQLTSYSLPSEEKSFHLTNKGNSQSREGSTTGDLTPNPTTSSQSTQFLSAKSNDILNENDEGDEIKSNSSVTPKDILLRGRSLTKNYNELDSALPSSLAINSNINTRDFITSSLQDLDIGKKSTDAISNSSSYSSPRRHLSPAPYVEKHSFSSLQRNTNSKLESTPTSSPSLQYAELNTGGTERPDQLYERPSQGSGGYGGNHLSISSSNNSGKGSLKPPLSPLLVSQTPSSKPSYVGIKDYEIIKAISKGAFGSVFLAKRKLTGDYVAIKCLKKRDMIAKNQILNVRSERAVMMRQTDSPYVAQLYCSFQTKDYLYLVMEYLNGGDCATLLKVLGTLGPPWACRYTAEVVVGVEDLHKRGIIHRDLKPDNLLIDSKGHLKLTDFGLSRLGVVGRQARKQRNSSTSEQAIEIFRKSINQPGASGSATVTTPLTALFDSPSSDSSSHQRNMSDTSFTLSPTAENTKITSPTLQTLSTSSTNANPALIDSYRQSSPQPHQQIGLLGNRSLQPVKTSMRTGSMSSAAGSPLLKPILPRTASESSFSIVEDDIPFSPWQNTNSTYALFDPENESNEIKKFVGTPDYLAPETIEGVGQSNASDWWSLGCILFEFLFGYPPFHASTPNEVFKNILKCNINWPPLSEEEEAKICPPDAKDLINKLLTLEPEKRLGHNGADEIKNHPFFKGIDWETLFVEEPSFVPIVDNPESTDYFDTRGAELSQFPKEDSDEEKNTEREKAASSSSVYGGGLLGNSSGSRGSISGGNSSIHPSNSFQKERRGSRFTDPSEFGSFHFRNLNVLEKANKDIINRLKTEHMEHRVSFSSSSSESTPYSRSRGLSFSGSNNLNSSGSPFKRPTSPASFLNQRASSPGKMDKEHLSSNSPRVSSRHERLGLSVSNYSSGEDYYELGRTNSSNDNLKFLGGHRPSIHSLSKQIFKTASDSPTSSDTEDYKSLALMRVRKRRESSRRQGSHGGLFSPTGSTNSSDATPPRLYEFDILYCEPNPAVRHANCKLLESIGCIVVTVSDGDELIRRSTSQVKFDMIFTALKLPRVDVSDAVKLIKYTSTINSDTPIVAITGLGKEAADMMVFDDILERPVSVKDLKNCFNRCFYSSSIHDAEAVESDS